MSTASQIINLNPVEPARIGFRQARGVALNCDFRFVRATQPVDISAANPQLVLRPRSRAGADGYSMIVVDAINGSAHVDIPGSAMRDQNGYRAEVYFCEGPQAQPTRLVAEGALSWTGWGYETEGPLGPASYPVGPSGPAGPAGPIGPPGIQGVRGATWRNGHGDPVVFGNEVTGDMYLNDDNGDVWSWNDAWMRGG